MRRKARGEGKVCKRKENEDFNATLHECIKPSSAI
jgi:hypothetical protein